MDLEWLAAEEENIDQLQTSEQHQKHIENYYKSRGLSQEQFFEDIIERTEQITGPLVNWQRFYLIAAVSGRGVQWAQTRGRPHYHIVGISCPICGRQ